MRISSRRSPRLSGRRHDRGGTLTEGRRYLRSKLEPAPGTATLVLVLAGISLGAILALGIAALVESFRAKALRAEVERRAEARSLAYVGLLAKNDLLTWRINELQGQADELLAKRDGLLDELGVLTTKTSGFARRRGTAELLAGLTGQLVVMPEMPTPTIRPSSIADRAASGGDRRGAPERDGRDRALRSSEREVVRLRASLAPNRAARTHRAGPRSHVRRAKRVGRVEHRGRLRPVLRQASHRSRRPADQRRFVLSKDPPWRPGTSRRRDVRGAPRADRSPGAGSPKDRPPLGR